MKTYRRLLIYIKSYWKYMLGALICTILVAACTLVPPKLVGFITDILSGEKALSNNLKSYYLNLIILSFILITILKGFFSYAQGYLMNYAGQGALKKMREGLFSHLQLMPMSFYGRFRDGELYSRTTNDIGITINFYTNLVVLVNDLLVVIYALSYMFFTDWKMTLLNLIVSPMVGLTIIKFGKKAADVTSILQSKVADLSNIIYESFSNMKIIKAFSREDYQVKKFAHKNEENFSSIMKLIQVSITQSPVIEFLGALGLMIVVWFGAHQVIKGKMSFGEIMAYWGYMVIITQPISRLTGIYTQFQTAKASALRVFEILDIPNETKHLDGYIEIKELKGKIEFKNVSFAYGPEKLVLNKINLVINPGDIVALVGQNGAGKTSLANLVPRFYEPLSGKILIDGIDISKIKLKSLRSQIAVVPQETILFAQTIKENILYGKIGASLEEVISAAKSANAHNFITELPQKYDTLVGERGLKLSGGQRQRIAIARALLRNPQILILDEFTSGIDSESENLIIEAIENLMKGRTCLVIAHRLSTIRNAHKIVVLEEGNIKEIGTHLELLIKGGLYTRFYETQLQNLEAV
ncbi:MAG: ABC transporter ATP-binding protein [Armatimonadetes bacterium]|nr:ABC transporter ATP-binding protein [Armatimonadota bacterium]